MSTRRVDTQPKRSKNPKDFWIPVSRSSGPGHPSPDPGSQTKSRTDPRLSGARGLGRVGCAGSVKLEDFSTYHVHRHSTGVSLKGYLVYRVAADPDLNGFSTCRSGRSRASIVTYGSDRYRCQIRSEFWYTFKKCASKLAAYLTRELVQLAAPASLGLRPGFAGPRVPPSAGPPRPASLTSDPRWSRSQEPRLP